MFSTENGSEYFPFESVYAIGEVKSTLSSKGQIECFIDTIRSVKRDLKREPTPPTYVGNGLNLGQGFSTSERRPFRNPLFAFMLFISAGEFNCTRIDDLFTGSSIEDLPNITCILDQGVIINAVVKPAAQAGTQQLGSLNLTPEFNKALGDNTSRWCFVPFGEEATRPASILGFLWMALVNHLNSSFLMRPDMLTYLNKILRYGPGRVVEQRPNASVTKE